MRLKHSMFLLLAGLVIAPNLLWSQGPPRGFGGGGFDPEQIFNGFSGGADSIKISELPADKKMFAEKMIQRMGIQGDVVTREQFKTGMQNGMANFGKGKGGPGGLPAPGTGGFPSLPAGFVPPTMPGFPNMDAEAEAAFKGVDKNNDGFLTKDEIPDNSKLTEQNTFGMFDLDRDGKISLQEYKMFYNWAKTANRDPFGKDAQHAPAGEDERPTIYRAGKLPKELPAWFGEIDKKGDNDGQVGLDEWNKFSGKSIDEFQSMDLNNDGLLTAEEYLKFKKRQDEVAKNNPSQSQGTQTSVDPTAGFQGGRGGFGGGGFGGGFGKGGKGGPPGGGMAPAGDPNAPPSPWGGRGGKGGKGGGKGPGAPAKN